MNELNLIKCRLKGLIALVNLNASAVYLAQRSQDILGRRKIPLVGPRDEYRRLVALRAAIINPQPPQAPKPPTAGSTALVDLNESANYLARRS